MSSKMNGDPMKTVSLIIPAYNEEEAIPYFLERIVPLLDAEPYTFEMIFIDDGSKDRTLEILLEARQKDPRIRIIELARNFGKELAMTAEFHAASGDAVVPMDVDLQDPPELLSDFLRKWEEGYDVVLGVRRQRESDTMFKRITAGLFYKIFNILCGKRLVPNAGDYRLMNRAALDALNSLPERVRFTKGCTPGWVSNRLRWSMTGRSGSREAPNGTHGSCGTSRWTALRASVRCLCGSGAISAWLWRCLASAMRLS